MAVNRYEDSNILLLVSIYVPFKTNRDYVKSALLSPHPSLFVYTCFIFKWFTVFCWRNRFGNTHLFNSYKIPDVTICLRVIILKLVCYLLAKKQPSKGKSNSQNVFCFGNLTQLLFYLFIFSYCLSMKLSCQKPNL